MYWYGDAYDTFLDPSRVVHYMALVNVLHAGFNCLGTAAPVCRIASQRLVNICEPFFGSGNETFGSGVHEIGAFVMGRRIKR
jgi:hypothetical protein